MRIVKSKDIKDVRTVVYDYFGVDLTPEQTTQLLEDEEVVDEVLKFGAFDTCTRSIIAGALVDKLTEHEFHEWPCNGDSAEDVTRFNDAFKAGAFKFGYKLTDVWE